MLRGLGGKPIDKLYVVNHRHDVVHYLPQKIHIRIVKAPAFRREIKPPSESVTLVDGNGDEGIAVDQIRDECVPFAIYLFHPLSGYKVVNGADCLSKPPLAGPTVPCNCPLRWPG